MSDRLLGGEGRLTSKFFQTPKPISRTLTFTKILPFSPHGSGERRAGSADGPAVALFPFVTMVEALRPKYDFAYLQNQIFGPRSIRDFVIVPSCARSAPGQTGRYPTTSFLTATKLTYTIGAGITAAAGTRLALQWFLVKGFKVYSFRLPGLG